MVLEFAQGRGFDGVAHLGSWNIYNVYEPIRDETVALRTGVPHLILVFNGIVRWATPEEAFESIGNTMQWDQND